jgi:ubiquinone biosynthesis protein COQ9
MATLAELDPAAMKIRERIRVGAMTRIDAAMTDRPAVEAAGIYLARPDRAPGAVRLGWDTADRLWRWAGDVSTDANHYSKRALLGAILAATMAARLSRGREAAERTLEVAIEGVMNFERLKAKLPSSPAGLTALAAVLGRLRYGG